MDIDAGVPRQHIFVWLRRNAQESVAHEEHGRGTREQEILTPAYQEVTVPFNSLSGDLHVCTSPPRPLLHSAVDAFPHIPLKFPPPGMYAICALRRGVLELPPCGLIRRLFLFLSRRYGYRLG